MVTVDTRRAGDDVAIRRAREAFLSDHVLAPVVRADVGASWRRCDAWGVSPDRLDNVERNDLDDDGTLVWAARPVLDRLAERLAETETALYLADPRAVIIERWVGDVTLRRSLDRVHSVPCASLAERDAGTNGLGTPIQTGNPIVIDGPEHFVSPYHGFCCAGVPIRDPGGHGVAGGITLAYRAGGGSRLALPLLLTAADEVRARLVAAAGRTTVPPHAPSPSSRPPDPPATSARGPRPRLRDLVGEHPSWIAVRQRAAGGIGFEVPVLVRGEPGTGKLTLLGAMWEEHAGAYRRQAVGNGRDAATGGGTPIVFDLALVQLEGPRDFLGRLRRELARRDRLVVVRHVELADDGLAAALCSLLDEADGRGAAIGSTLTVERDGVTGGSNTLPHRLGDRLAGLVLDVPPLAERASDVGLLVEATTLELGGPHPPVWRRPTLEALSRADWPGNVRQLRTVVRRTIVGRHRPVDPGDVADVVTRHTGSGRTRIENAERAAIVEALHETDGNKAAAAAALGISRATIYRKIRAYDIDPSA